MENKRAQLGSLQTIIVSIVIIGIFLGIGFLVINELKDQLSTQTATVEGESFTGLGNTTNGTQYVDYNYTTANIPCWTSVALVAAYNSSDDTTIEIGNLTLTSTTGMIMYSAAGADWNGTPLNINYTYVYGQTGCESIETTEEAIATIPTWLTIIILLVIVGIIVAIVSGVLPTGLGKGSSGTTAQI